MEEKNEKMETKFEENNNIEMETNSEEKVENKKRAKVKNNHKSIIISIVTLLIIALLLCGANIYALTHNYDNVIEMIESMIDNKEALSEEEKTDGDTLINNEEETEDISSENNLIEQGRYSVKNNRIYWYDGEETIEDVDGIFPFEVLEYDDSNENYAEIYFVINQYGTEPGEYKTIQITDEFNNNLLLEESEERQSLCAQVEGVKIKKIDLNQKINFLVNSKYKHSTGIEIEGVVQIKIDLEKDLEPKVISQNYKWKFGRLGDVSFRYINSEEVSFEQKLHKFAIEVQYGNHLSEKETIYFSCDKNVNNLNLEEAFEYAKNSIEYDHITLIKDSDIEIGCGINAIKYQERDTKSNGNVYCTNCYMFIYNNNIYKIETSANDKISDEVQQFLDSLECSQVIQGEKCLNKYWGEDMTAEYEIDDEIEKKDREEVFGVNVSKSGEKLYLTWISDEYIQEEHWDERADYYLNIIEKNKPYEIANVNVNNIKNIYMGYYGQAVTYPVAFFLMNDGSVEWLKIKDAFVNKDFVAEGKIENVKEVVQIINAIDCSVSDGNEGLSRGATTIAIREDGNFYDLRETFE